MVLQILEKLIQNGNKKIISHNNRTVGKCQGWLNSTVSSETWGGTSPAFSSATLSRGQACPPHGQMAGGLPSITPSHSDSQKQEKGYLLPVSLLELRNTSQEPRLPKYLPSHWGGMPLNWVSCSYKQINNRGLNYHGWIRPI